MPNLSWATGVTSWYLLQNTILMGFGNWFMAY